MLIKHKKESLLTNAGVSELVSQTHDNYKMFKSYLVLNFNYVSYLIRHEFLADFLEDCIKTQAYII